MGPKLLPRGHRSKQKVPDYIPIYDILVDKTKDNAVKDLSQKLQILAKHDISAINKTFFIFILKICGLSNCIQKLDEQNQINSLLTILQQMGQQTNKNIFINELYLINFNSKFYVEFIQRIKKFLSIIFNNQIFNIQNTNIIKIFYQTLLTISKCKMRNIRNCSIIMTGFVLKQLSQMYKSLKQRKNNKKGDNILNIINKIYLQQLILPRLKDIDIKIRQKSFQILNQLFLQLKYQFINVNTLNYFYTQILISNQSKIIQLALKSIIQIFSIDTDTISFQIKKNIQDYAVNLIKILQEIVLIPNKNSCLAMEILALIHNLNPKLDSLKPKVIAKIFQIHGYQKFQQGLKKAVNIFFKSLVTFSSKEDLNEYRSRLIIQIIHLLCSINSKKLLQTILQQFFNGYPTIFTFDQMFLLLFTEYYNQDDKNIELQSKQLAVLCTMICQFNIYLRQSLQKYEQRQKQQISYNKNVLTNSKQIIFDKIQKHQQISYLYLRLFSILYKPITQNYLNLINFIYQKIIDIIKQQQYLTLADNSLIIIQQIIKYSLDICQFVFDGHPRIQALAKNFGIYQIVDKNFIDHIDIIKISSLIAKFQIPQLISVKIIKTVINNYPKLKDKIIKLQSIVFVYHCHKWLFISLFNSPSVSKHQQYIQIRNLLMQFFIQTILENISQDSIVRLASFNTLCKTLQLTSNKKIVDIPIIYFEPSHSQMQTIYHFIDEYIHFDNDQSLGDITTMIANISIQTQQIRQQIFHNIFELFNQCYKLSLNKLSINFLIKCMLQKNLSIKLTNKYLNNFFNQLIKNQIALQNNNKFVFWKVFNQFFNQLSSNFSNQQQKQHYNTIINKLLDSYYKYKHKNSQARSLLSNKLILYIADTIDKSINTQNYKKLTLIKYILNKVYRRFPKQILHRLLIFYNSKTQQLQNIQIKQLRQLIKKISKVSNKNIKKQQIIYNENQSQKSIESQQQENYLKSNSSQEKNQDQENYDSQQRVEETPIQVNMRNTRSKTKRKI